MRLWKIIAPLCVSSVMFAGSVFVSSNTPLYSTASGGTQLGELFVASTLKELSKSGEFSEVEFMGFMPEGSTTVYEKAGVLMTGFEVANSSTLQIIGKQTNEYGSVWVNVSIKGFVKSSMLSGDKMSVLKQGETLFKGKCGTCHALHPETEFEPNVWPSILETMGAQAALSKNERYSIEKYLQNFKR